MVKAFLAGCGSWVIHVAAGAALLFVSGCASLPRSPDRETAWSLSPSSEGLLHESRQAVLEGANEEASAFLLLDENAEALQWRLALIDQATRSIDLQYFIWESDEVGRLIFERVIAAWKRGVRVRILVDDLPSKMSDQGTAELSRREGFYIRRFNPHRSRSGKVRPALEWLFFLRDLNPRMHNKLMVVDGQWAIVGGRNIGNPYFGLSKKYNFLDLDVLVTGSVVPELGVAFDDFWNSEAAYPGESMSGRMSQRTQERRARKFVDAIKKDQELLSQTEFIQAPFGPDHFNALPQRMVPGVAVYLQDEPVVRGDRGKRLTEQLAQLTDEHAHETIMVSPYFIPPDELVEYIGRATRAGSDITILTASLGANNQTATHSHYKKYRKRLVDAGAQLHEFRHEPSEAVNAMTDTAPVEADFTSLHVKGIIQDRRHVYVGSLNLDPRAMVLNTENILAIDSPALAEEILAHLDEVLQPENAWQIKRNSRGALRWYAGEEKARRQPARSFRQRVADWILRWFPIESQL